MPRKAKTETIITENMEPKEEQIQMPDTPEPAESGFGNRRKYRKTGEYGWYGWRTRYGNPGCRHCGRK